MHVLNTELICKVDCYLDENHEKFSSLGGQFFEIFGSDKGKISTQVRNLQQIACSATRFADVEDFVKNQMGKESKDKGDKKWMRLGNDVLKQLTRLRKFSQDLADDEYDRMALRLRLARGWARAVVSEYLYRLALRRMAEDDA